MYSYRIEQAIRAAAILHKDQLRKGPTRLPYVTHLFAVTLILSDYTDDEDTLVAGLLHDTLEDTDYTAKELQDDFGAKVRDIVEALSEPQSTADREISWKEQKKQYIKQLKNAPLESIMISAADKIHNMRTAIEEYFNDHRKFLNDFEGSLDERALRYQDISNIINSRLKNDIIHEFNHIYTEYKNFIADVKKSTEKAESF